jgi:hypothetical protein
MPNDKTASPAVELRRLRLGDRWSYTAAGSLTAPDGGTLPLIGEIKVSIVPGAMSGRDDQMTIQFSQDFEVLQPDGARKPLPAPTWMFSFIQDADTADVAIASDNMGPGGARRTAKAPQVFYPGRWSGATAYDNRLDFDNGDYVKNSLAVVGQESIETARGSFLAWKSTITSESTTMGLIEGVDWWTPELGAPVRFSTDAGMPDGSRIRFLATLSDTNVLTG